MSLHIIHSNRVEKLLDDLSDKIATPLPEAGFLEGETILLDNQVLGKWLNLKLAMKNSVAANINYVQLSRVFWELARTLVSSDIPKQDPFDKKEMTWRLMGVLENKDVLDNPSLKPVKNYLVADDTSGTFTDLKRYQLAASVADLFDQYLIYRPEWINGFWDRSDRIKLGKEYEPGGENETGGNDATTKLWRNAEAWQRVLWHEMVKSVDKTGGLHHRAAIQQKLFEQLNAGLGEGAPPFRRLFVFGVTSMSEAQIDLLMLLGKYIDINLYILNPCEHEWFQIRSEKRIIKLEQLERRLNRCDERKTDRRQRVYSEELEFMEVGNPLLAGQAAQVQDFIELIYRKSDQYLEHAEVQDIDYFEDPGEQTLLRCMQKEILELQYCDEVATLEPQSGGGIKQPIPQHELISGQESLRSIHIHNCHSPQREVEVLYDQLLDIFSKNPDIKPRDVVVMMPKVAPYVPFINAIFEGAAGNNKIRYHISDRTLQEESPILNSFETLLKLPDSRLPLSEILGLFEIPAVHRRFDLDREGYEQLKSWLIASGARWGLDATHRNEVGLPSYSDFSWNFGMNRLLAGYGMTAKVGSDEGSESAVLLDMVSSREDALGLKVLPLDDVEGSGAEVLDSFLRFWNKLKDYRNRLNNRQSPLEWKDALDKLLDDFYKPEEDEWRALNELRRGIADLELAADEKNTWYEGKLPLEVVRAMMQPVLQQPGKSQQPWSEGVKFCSLLPMRGVPFKVVYLMGMNMEDYPRRIVPKSFDLMRFKKQPGDRSARTDDRWLFLEALLSARDAFYISYVGQDMHRNEKREPSVLVSELIDYIRDGYELPEDAVDPFDGRELEQDSYLYTKHKLQPFNPEYFKEGKTNTLSRLFSYNQQAYEVANSQLIAREGEPVSGDERWQKSSLPDSGVMEVSLDDFVKFFTKPWDWFFKKKQVSLSRYGDDVSDEEVFALQQGLGPWKVLNELLDQINRHRANDDCTEKRRKEEVRSLVEKQKASGAWPIGPEGEAQENKLKDLKLDYIFMLTGVERVQERIDVEVPVTFNAENGSRMVRLKIVGELERHGDEFLIQSASNASKKHILDFYIRLAVGCNDSDFRKNIGGARAVFKDTAKPSKPGKVKGLPLNVDWVNTDEDFLRHQALLQTLARLYLDYSDTGLPFHPELSLEEISEDETERLLVFEKQWFGTGGEYDRCIKDDIKERTYFGGPASLSDSDQFIGVANKVRCSFNQWLDGGEE